MAAAPRRENDGGATFSLLTGSEAALARGVTVLWPTQDTFTKKSFLKDSQPTMAPLWALGVGLLTIGSISSSAGMLLMKRSADTEAHLPIIKRKFLFIGIFLNVGVPGVVDSISFSITPLSMIAPFAGVAIVFSSVFAASGCCGVHAPLSTMEGGSITLVVVGVTIVSLIGPHGEGEPGLELIETFFRSPSFLAFLCGCVLSVGSWMCVLLVPAFGHCRPPRRSQRLTVLSALAAATCSAFTQISVKIVSTALREAGGQSSSAWLRAGSSLPTLAALCTLCLSGPLQLFLMNRSLGDGDVNLAVPAYLSFVILLNVAAGCTFFQEWSRFRARSAVAEFVLGIGCVVAGLWALSRHQQQKLRNAAPSASVVAQPLENSTDANLHSEMHVPMLRIDAARTSGTIQSISRVGSSSPLFEEAHPGESVL